MTCSPDAGILDRRPYSDRPARSEYVLTDAWRDLKPVIIALGAWGIQHDPPPENPVVVDATTGREVAPFFTDGRSGRDLNDPEIVFRAAADGADPVSPELTFG